MENDFYEHPILNSPYKPRQGIGSLMIMVN